MNPLPPDPYKALGVSKTSQIPEIRTAYRKLVLTCHPDKVQDPALKAEKLDEFQRVQQAYELLTNEDERQRYDDGVRFMELRKEMAKNMANSSAPRTPPRHYNVKTAEPRASTFAQGSSPMPSGGARVYAQYPPPRSDDYLYVDPKGIHPEVRSARRTTSYEKDRPSKKDEERARRRREREDEEERERERERTRELEREIRERERRAADKDRKAEKKRVDKERKLQSEEKRSRHRSPYDAYVEPSPYEEEDSYDIKPEKKKPSSSRRPEPKRERSAPREEVQVEPSKQKMNANMHQAYSYIKAGRVKLGDRAATFDAATFNNLRNSPPSVPTPPPARDSPFAPIVEEDEPIHRSRAVPRRGSYDAPKARERSSGHRKTHSGPEEDEPVIVTASPTTRHSPAYAKPNVSSPMMPEVPESPPRGPLRAKTFHEPSSSRPMPVPGSGLPRANTFSGESADSNRGRGRTRLQPQVEEAESSDDDRRRPEPRKHRSSRRNPSPDYQPPRQHTTYTLRSDGRTKLQELPIRGSPDRGHSKAAYYKTTSGIKVYETRPYSSQREAGYGGAEYFPKVQTSRSYTKEDVQYASYGNTRMPAVYASGSGNW